MSNPNLWCCLNARYPVTGKGRIICRAGHELPKIVDAENVQLGEVFGKKDCPVCFECVDFLSMGPPLRKSERGWI